MKRPAKIRHCYLEPLEARIAPATFTWINPTSGAWTTPANWSVGGVDADGIPDADDDVTINPATVGLVVTISGGAQAVNTISVPGDDVLAVTGGGLTIGAASSISNLQLSGGGVTATGQLTLTGTSIFSSNATLAGTVRNEGTLSIFNDPNLGGTLENVATIRNDGSLDFIANGRVDNAVGALFDITVGGNFSSLREFGGIGFFNSGTFRHSGSGGHNVGAVPFHNLATGVIEVTGGQFGFGSNGTWDGANISVSSGTVLNLEGGTKTWTGTFTGTGAGALNFNNGLITVGAAGATLNFSASLFTWAVNAEINGGPLTNAVGSSLRIINDPNLGTTLTNLGTVINDGSLDFIANGRFNNAAGALFDIAVGGNFSSLRQFSGGIGFFNSGTFRHSGSGGHNVGAVAFHNLATGVIEVTGGQFGFGSNGTWDDASISVSSGTVLNLEGGTKTWTGTFTGTGAGALNFTNGLITIGAAGATVNFPAGMFTWMNDAGINGGPLINAAGSSMRITNDPDLGTTLTNLGTVINDGSLDFVTNGRVDNAVGALFDITVGGSFSSLRQFSGSIGFFNSGTFRHSGSGGHNVGAVPFSNLATGVIEVTGGQFGFGSNGTWDGADFRISSGTVLNLEGGTKTWTGTFTGTGAGALNFTNGLIAVGAAGATVNFPAGMFTWMNDAGINGGPLTNAAGSSLRIINDPDLGTTLNNLGTVINDGSLDFITNGRLNNAVGALFDITVGGNFSSLREFGGIGFFNSGTFRHSGSGSHNVGAVAFHNLVTGVIEVTGGQFGFGSNGTWDGADFRISSGTVLNLEGGTKTWTGTFTGTGAGALNFNNGLITVGAAGATLNFQAGLFTWAANPTINGGPLTNAVGSSLRIINDPNLGTTLNNLGTVINDGSLDFVTNGRFNNAAGALFDITVGGNFSSLREFGGIGFFNSGTFRHSGAGVHNVGAVPFSNFATGVIEVTAGTLGLGSNGTWDGASFSVSTGTVLNLEGGTKTWTGTFTGSGAGALNFNGGTITIGAAGATLDFPAGLFTWRGNSTINGAPFANVGFVSTLNDPNLGATLNNSGTINNNARFDFVAGGRLNNLAAGVFDITGTAGNISYFGNFGGPGFFNDGLFRKLGPALANGSTVPFSNAGTVEIVQGSFGIGSLPQLNGGTLNGGTWIVRNGATLDLPGTGIATNSATIIREGTTTFADLNALTTNAGSLALLGGADFTRTGNFVNTGDLILSPGSVLTINGAFTQNEGRTEFQIADSAASGLFGRIAVSGAATLGGTLAVETLGSFAPAAGEGYTLMTYASRTGDFAVIEGIDQSFNPVFEAVAGVDNYRLNSLIAAPDLEVTSVTAPPAGFVGRDITLSYTVTNLSDRPATVSDWTDAIYLSRDGTLDAGDFLVARVPHTGGLAAFGSYTETFTRPVPGALEGDYQVLVIADNRNVAPDLARENNRRLAPGTIDIGIETLPLGTPVSGTIATGQDVFFQIDLASGTDIFFSGEFDAATQAEFLVRRDAIPTRTTFDFRGVSLAEIEQEIRLVNPRGGTYYILLHGREGAGAGEDFTLLAEAAPFLLDEIGQSTGANLGRVTVPLTGFGFAATLDAELRSQDGSVILAAERIEVFDGARAAATFDLTGVEPAVFDVVALQGGDERLLDQAFTVEVGEPGRLEARLVVPERVRMTRPYTITVEFENAGDTDLLVPLLIVQASAGNFLWAQGQTQAQQTDTLQFLGIDPDGFSGGVLRPGEKHAVVLNAVTNGTTANFKLASTAGDSGEVVDFASLRDSLQIAGEPPRYAAAFDRVATELGATYGELIQDLAQAADEARGLGQEVQTFTQAIDFLVDREILELPSANVTGALFVDDLQHRAMWPSLTLRSTTTDDFYVADSFLDGRFAFFDVPAGDYTLEADGFFSLSTSTLTIAAGTPLSGLNIIADPGETLQGRVANAGGRAVADALVQITDALGREFVTTTDRSGRYHVEGLAPGAATIDIDVANLIPVNDAALTLAGDTTVRDFALFAGGLIAGRVVSPTGTPVAGADVVARAVDGAFTREVKTGFDGRYRLGGLPTGTYELVATGVGFGSGMIGEVAVTNDRTTPVPNVALSTGGTVSGIITDAATGLPIAGAQFKHTATGKQNNPIPSNLDGGYTASNLTPGSFAGLVSAPGYIDGFAPITLATGENETVNFALRPLGKIDGVVRGGGTIAPGLSLTLLPLVTSLQAESLSAVSGADGSFSFAGLPDGQYALTVNAAGGTVARQVFTLNATDNTHTTTLDLGGTKVAGTLIDDLNAPLADELVTLIRNGERIDSAVTDAQGRYEFLVLQDGPIDLVTGSYAIGMTGVFGVNVAGGAAVTAPAIPVGTAPLTVQITAATSGAALADAFVEVRSTLSALDDVSLLALSDAAGQVALTNLVPGDYTVTITRKGFASVEQAVTISVGGGAANVALQPGRVLFGTVRGTAGSPVEFAEVTAVDEATGRAFTARTDLDGSYRFDSLPAGTFDLTLRGDDFAPALVNDVTVAALPVRADATLSASDISLAGVVADASGDPLAFADVRLRGAGNVILAGTTTDANGNYLLENLVAGAVQLTVTEDGFSTAAMMLTLPATGATTQNIAVSEAIATNLPSSPVTPAPTLPNPLSNFFPAWMLASAGAAKGLNFGPPNVPGLFDGSDNVSGLQPPAPALRDTPAFRFNFPDHDDDCPEQAAAYDAASQSGFLVDQAFDAYESTFKTLKNENDLALVEIGGITFEIVEAGVGLLDGVGDLKNAFTALKKLPNVSRANLEGIIQKGIDDTARLGRQIKGLQDNFAMGNLPGISDLRELRASLNTVIGEIENLQSLATTAMSVGDLGGLAELPVLGDAYSLIASFRELDQKVSQLVDSDLASQLIELGDAESLYLKAVEKHNANRKALEEAIANGCGDPAPDPDEPEDQDPEDDEDVPSVGSRDPNDIIGPAGFGPENFVAFDQSLDYTIRFENVATATAAAQLVTITHQLDADVDPATLQLGNFGFGGFVVEVPAGRDFYEARVDAVDTLGLLVDVEAKIDTFSGLVTWTFSAIDPDTLDFTADPLDGFLPPNNATGDGEGFVSYSIRTSDGTPSGTRIDAQATIVFDQNDPIDTPAIFHTIDAEAPASAVASLAATLHGPRVTLTVGGGDGTGSGVASYDLYVSEDGGPFTTYRSDVPAGSYTFRGESGKTYGFASAAKDNVGLTEALPLTPDATTTLDFAPLLFTKATPLKFTDADGDQVTIKLKGAGNGSIILDDPDGDGRGSIEFLALDGSTAKSKLTVSVKKKAGGDGAVTIGDVNIDGALGALTAKQADLVANGLVAGGNVKQIAVRDLLQPEPVFAQPLVQLAASAADSTSITARTLADGFAIATGGTIKKLSVGDLGDGTITAAAIKQLEVKTGDLNADIRLSGALGPVNVKKGSLADATITAAKIGDVTVKGSLLNAIILAGADLGDDSALGGGDDTFAAGSIGKVSIGGAVTASVLGAGFSSPDAVFKNTDDVILGGTASKIASLVVKGQADATSYFAAGKFTKKPKIAGTTVDPTTDPRFFVG